MRTHRRPILISHIDDAALARIARDDRAGVHSYMLLPLAARGQILGFLGLSRARTPQPFSEDDLALASGLASRAAVCIDNARSHQTVRTASETLQRSLLPDHPPHLPGLEVASRYRPAQAVYEVGGDWYDVLPLDGDKTALVVGDVLGSSIDAAVTMGRLRTGTSDFADFDLAPAQVAPASAASIRSWRGDDDRGSAQPGRPTSSSSGWLARRFPSCRQPSPRVHHRR